jgi:hypothetical protein
MTEHINAPSTGVPGTVIQRKFHEPHFILQTAFHHQEVTQILGFGPRVVGEFLHVMAAYDHERDLDFNLLMGQYCSASGGHHA